VKYLFENRLIDKDEHPTLIDAIEHNPPLQNYFESSFNGVKPKNCCGFLSIDVKRYFIIPKIVDDRKQNLDIFIFMLLYAYDVKLNNEALSNAVMQEHRIFELFIRLFSDGLLDEFKRGVFRQYVTMQENLKVLRGKYLFEKNFANFYHQNLYCEFDEFSMDNRLNRFFLYAIQTFKRYSHYVNLHRCEAVLGEVMPTTIDLRRHRMRFDRMSSRYQKSYEIAMILLQKLIPLTGSADRRSFAFLFDMAEVFEKFVGRLMQEIDPTARPQVQRNFGNLQLKPDIVTERMIIDTKYKSVKTKEELATHDKYQMFAYGLNFRKSDVMLLYPKHRVDVKEDLVLGEGENVVRLQMRSLDLGFDGGYSEFVEEMRRRLEEII
jgi:5-methylcytosine-specific restriction enzyme subunit McrC